MTWADNNYRHKKLVTIANAKVAGDETDFPVLISITDTDLTGCLSNGYDIKFYNSDEDTQLKHERESFDNSTGKLLAWVKIPSLSSTEDTLFYMYYEYPDEDTDQADGENVWDDNFMMVQHMNDTTTNTITDSTSNDNDGTKKGANEPIVTTSGKIGDAQVFDGTDDCVSITDSDSLDITDALTIEMWLNVQSTGAHIGLLNKYAWDPTRGYVLHFEYWTPNHYFAFTIDGARVFYTKYNSYVGSWTHLVVTEADTGSKLYANGVEIDSDAHNTGPTANTSYLGLGRDLDLAGAYFNGTIDEVRFSDSARTSNWISTTFETQNDPDAFMSWGDEEPPVVRRRGRVPFGLKPARIVRVGRIGA